MTRCSLGQRLLRARRLQRCQGLTAIGQGLTAPAPFRRRQAAPLFALPLHDLAPGRTPRRLLGGARTRKGGARAQSTIGALRASAAKARAGVGRLAPAPARASGAPPPPRAGRAGRLRAAAAAPRGRRACIAPPGPAATACRRRGRRASWQPPCPRGAAWRARGSAKQGEVRPSRRPRIRRFFGDDGRRIRDDKMNSFKIIGKTPPGGGGGASRGSPEFLAGRAERRAYYGLVAVRGRRHACVVAVSPRYARASGAGERHLFIFRPRQVLPSW